MLCKYLSTYICPSLNACTTFVNPLMIFYTTSAYQQLSKCTQLKNSINLLFDKLLIMSILVDNSRYRLRLMLSTHACICYGRLPATNTIFHCNERYGNEKQTSCILVLQLGCPTNICYMKSQHVTANILYTYAHLECYYYYYYQV